MSWKDYLWMWRWEYSIDVTRGKVGRTVDLDKLGKEGWELTSVNTVSIDDGIQDYKFIFKRKVYNEILRGLGALSIGYVYMCLVLLVGETHYLPFMFALIVFLMVYRPWRDG
jgi:hypothetical protein